MPLSQTTIRCLPTGGWNNPDGSFHLSASIAMSQEIKLCALLLTLLYDNDDDDDDDDDDNHGGDGDNGGSDDEYT
ncbi:hypothetical protein PoB_007081900 [Plakobranchus ocellatus]|uniref:Uncharacterized protein n=1 Tax=Plakobranchus ocellatus TaxID=259542 RepID=A0AAV4DJC7_9GAST|nr:hypothetical protein PoB_007081900 [Plakobranchus ocellatus]